MDAHRKKQQAAHPGLTITDMYNVLEKLRAGDTLTAKEKTIHEQGLVSVLKQIHDDLDAAVFDAYGWGSTGSPQGPPTLPDEQILEKLVALNAERAAEEKRGLIRWLRPEFQNKGGTQLALPATEPEQRGKAKKSPKARPAKRPWPKTMAEQAKAVREALAAAGKPVTADELTRLFSRGNAQRIVEIVQTLVSLGQARSAGDGRYMP